MDHPYLGWADPVGTLDRLEAAVRTLAEGRSKTGDRWTSATSSLLHLRPDDFPDRLRKRAANVLSLRGSTAVAVVASYTHFRFAEMTPRERARFVGDLIALYAACLIDIGRTWPEWDFVYPADI